METTWDFSLLEKGKSFAEKRKEWKKVAADFVKKWKGRKDYLEKPSVMREALDDYEKLCGDYDGNTEEYSYYWLKTRLDENDPELKAKFLKVDSFSKEIENDTSFFVLGISKIPREKQKSFLEFGELSDYRHFLERIFENAKHYLSENEEKIMNLKSTSSYSSWVKMVSGFLAKEEAIVPDESGKKSKRNFSEITNLLRSGNKEVRDSAAKEFNKILEKYSDTAEAEINAILNDKKVNDELRGFKRPDKARHVADDIDSEVVDSLVKAVSENFHISKRFYELKAKLLGLKKLEYHERNVSYGNSDRKYSYHDSFEIVYKVFKDLDAEFAEIFRRFNENGQIDVFPKKGKSDGAFCTYFHNTSPVFVMLNHADTLHDVGTIAHEMGHAINFELMKKQNSLNFGTPLSTAEVASTFMEDFVNKELAKHAEDESRLSLMMEKLNEEVSTIMRQVACYEFEQEMHKEFREKGYLSKNEIGKIFQKHMKDYMGDFVEQSGGSENWWVYWGHIRTFFYVYSYASGLLISKSLQRMVKSDSKNISKVKNFLSAGLSKSPKEIFMELGIDITRKEFWSEGLKEMEDLLNETESLAKELGKI
ncbi:MAG: M3 family oligoendopeptidase [Nanoarchaeota archaeon]|nr:M3 family oligoendopeptidase [Nanoarchaeota archaeon]